MEKIERFKKDRLFIVTQNNKTSGELGYDEMLGLISSLTMPENRPCLQWMKTKEEIELQKKF